MVRAKKFDLGSERAFDNFSAYRAEELKAGRRFIWARVGDSRSSQQNALSFALYGQIAAQVEDQTVEEIRRQCKLDYGVPILLQDDTDFHDIWYQSIGLLNYEQRLVAMKWTQVTSKFNKRQFSEYVDRLITDFSKQGISIIFPGEEW